MPRRSRCSGKVKDRHRSSQTAAVGDGLNLLDLPDNCLHRIVRFMGRKTRQQFFSVSKGSQDKPGCAMLVLGACESRFLQSFGWETQPQPALRTILHWAAQLSTDMRWDVDCDFRGLTDLLHSLLVFPPGQDAPATYPGITCLGLAAYESQCLIPELLVKAFPNLKQLNLHEWQPRLPLDDEPGPVLKQGLAGIQCVNLRLPEATPATEHVSQLLRHIPASTFQLSASTGLFKALPASVLANLTHLETDAHQRLTGSAKAALAACSQLHSLKLWGANSHSWLTLLPKLVPHLRELTLECALTNANLPHLLALPNLTALTAQDVDDQLSADHSKAACKWRRLCFTGSISNHITNLPLHTLDSPVEAGDFWLQPTRRFEADMAAIEAAKRHLLRCGGIMLKHPPSMLLDSNNSGGAVPAHSDLLQEWAPCFAKPMADIVTYDPEFKWFTEELVASLWPKATWDLIEN